MKCQEVIFAARSRALWQMGSRRKRGSEALPRSLPMSSVTQVVPRNQEEATGEPQMLVERILCRESLRWPKLPVPIGHKRRGEGERTQRERAEPAPVSRQDGDGRDELQSKHRDRKGHGRREAEVIHFGEGFVEIRQLDDATLQVRGTQPKQGNPSHCRRGESRQSVRQYTHINTLQNAQHAQPKSPHSADSRV